MRCQICGNPFDGKPNQIYCSVECVKTARKMRYDAIAFSKKSRRNEDVVEIAVKARQEGMSYGKYVAKYGL